MINGLTKIYGIIGNPVSHSLSPVMHNAAFASMGVDSVYVPFHVDDVKSAVHGIKGLNIQGASVTIPHKETVIPWLDVIDPVAAKIGAVNTLHVTGAGSEKIIHGSNTDWVGANRALEQKIQLSGKRIVLLGAGGSARALGFGLQEKGAIVTLCSRTQKRGEELAELLGCEWSSLADVDRLDGDVLINATSVGMKPSEKDSLVGLSGVEKYHVVMDIVYSPLKTTMLGYAEQAGCEIVNGLDMLLYQGVAQFELWTGKSAPVDLMRGVLLTHTGNI